MLSGCVCAFLENREEIELLNADSSPISFNDPLGDGVSDFIVNDFVVCTAYEELVLSEGKFNFNSHEGCCVELNVKQYDTQSHKNIYLLCQTSAHEENIKHTSM